MCSSDLQMHPKSGEGAGTEGLVVRAAYDDGDTESSGRIQSVEILRESTGEVLRQALWVERDGLPGGYFAPDGTSYEHSLWTAPVTFTRISRGIGNFKTTARKPVVKRNAKGSKVVMVRTTKLLAQLTHQVAIVQYPSLQLSSVRHIELVSMPSRRVMVVVIADTGRVEQRMVEVQIGRAHV